jgi:hypothetical protein
MLPAAASPGGSLLAMARNKIVTAETSGLRNAGNRSEFHGHDKHFTK